MVNIKEFYDFLLKKSAQEVIWFEFATAVKKQADLSEPLKELNTFYVSRVKEFQDIKKENRYKVFVSALDEFLAEKLPEQLTLDELKEFCSTHPRSVLFSSITQAYAYRNGINRYIDLLGEEYPVRDSFQEMETLQEFLEEKDKADTTIKVALNSLRYVAKLYVSYEGVIPMRPRKTRPPEEKEKSVSPPKEKPETESHLSSGFLSHIYLGEQREAKVTVPNGMRKAEAIQISMRILSCAVRNKAVTNKSRGSLFTVSQNS